MARPFAVSFALLLGACGLFLEEYRIDDSKLKGASCQLGEQRCVGDWLVGCTPALDGWSDVSACALPDRCNSAAGTCAACANGEYRCDGAALQVCNADRSGWDTVETCSNGTACNLNLQACVACTPNEFQCNGGVLSQCNAQGSWASPTQCGSPELCVVAENRSSGQCIASAMCKPGEYACQEARLVRCDAQGVTWLGIETCASAALCKQTLSSAGSMPGLLACVPATCDADQARCDNNQLLVCSPERTGFTQTRTCSADNPCNPKLRDCGRCTPGEKFCSGADLLTCDNNGVFQRSATCATRGLCDAEAGVCDPPECDQPGHSACDQTQPRLVQCAPDLRVRVSYCVTPALCNAREGRCEQPRCAAQAVRCDGGRLQHCNPDQTGWDTDLTCADGSYCDVVNKACTAGTCKADSYRCNDVYLERCGANGYQRVARCAAPALCHADTARCDPPECMLGTFHCIGKSLQDCHPETLRWDDFDTCTGQCDDIGGRCL
ncbi:MAG: hypothetical protein ACOY0T_21800 [Myxococcota bacterium]